MSEEIDLDKLLFSTPPFQVIEGPPE